MSNLFEALKNLERRQAQPENPFLNAPEPQHASGNGIKRLLRQFLSRPFGVLIAGLSCAVLMGFMALFVMDWYLKKIPVQPQFPAARTNDIQTQQAQFPASSENTPREQPDAETDLTAFKTDTPAAQDLKATTDVQKPADAGQKTHTAKKMTSEPVKDTTHSESTGHKVVSHLNEGATQTTPVKKEQRQSDVIKEPDVTETQEIQGLTDIQIQAVSTPQDDMSRWQKNLLEQAETLRKNRRLDKAIPLYKTVWETTHDTAAANNLAAAYLAIEEPENAIAVLKEAIALSPHDEDLKYNMEVALRMLDIQKDR